MESVSKKFYGWLQPKRAWAKICFCFYFHKSNYEALPPLAGNGVGISDVADSTHQSRYEAPKLIKEQMFNRSASAAI